MKILIAEDDRIYRQALKSVLSGAGHAVCAATNGRKALELFRSERPDAVLLDVMMPVCDGLSACQEIRRLDSRVPVLFLTAKDAEGDELMGRGLGADDYIPKSVSDAVLVARLESVLRRAYPETTAVGFAFGEWTVDPLQMRMANACREAVSLSPREVALLRHFATYPGEVFSKDFLLSRFWGTETERSEGAVSTALHKLREKLGTSAACLETCWGSGVRYAGRKHEG